YRDISERKRAEEELESSRDELRRLATQLQLVREEERAAIAWELHDEVGQALAALQIDLHWLERRLSKDDTELLEKTQSMSGLIQSNVQRLRRLYMELRPGMLDDLGLAATIEWQAEEFQKRTGIKSVVSLDQDAGPRDADYSLAVYRVFQEALSNVTRHAEATEVNISLTKTDDRIVLEIADNGRGITKKQASAPGSSGLVGMRERLRPWGGKVTITGVPGKGTTIRVSIPVGKGEL
ncbi:MAG: sensor histidine kinase, partial [Dehalococcoidia bacterium]|nr:sensor histidine kinase [Dehalococcoidia bacterium]